MNSSLNVKDETTPTPKSRKPSSADGSKGALISTSLAAYAAELELACAEIDACEGEISDALVARFDDAKLALAAKVDRWIGYLDALKAMAVALKERKERATRALKTAEALQTRLKDYVKFVILQNPGIAFKGSEGALYLHKNPEGVRYAFAFEDKQLYRVVDKALLEMEPSLAPYVKTVAIHFIDSEKVRADLKAGIKIPWAELEQGSHLRVKG